MALYQVPEIGHSEDAVIAELDELRDKLRNSVRGRRRWLGGLRRLAFARHVQGSNSIEGYDAALDDVLDVVDDEPSADPSDETRHALQGYRDAMTYVMQTALDSEPRPIDEGMLKSLQFMMTRHDLTKHPGQWRPGSIWIEREGTRDVVYEAPPRESVPDLMSELVEVLAAPSDVSVFVRAAMAHLNLVMVHPFSDGNGRMARCLQTLVLARDRILAPEFSSIEEYLGHNTNAYYDVLAEVGQGQWNPQRDASEWVRFCLVAHYRQAQTVLRRAEEYEHLWNVCEDATRSRSLPPRSIHCLCDAARGLRIHNGRYRRLVKSGEGQDITELTATRDLARLVEAGLLEAVGERRARTYRAAADLRALWAQVRSDVPKRAIGDPFD